MEPIVDVHERGLAASLNDVRRKLHDNAPESIDQSKENHTLKPRRKSLGLSLANAGGRRVQVDEAGQQENIDTPLVTSRAKVDLPPLNENEDPDIVSETSQTEPNMHRKSLRNVEDITSTHVQNIFGTSCHAINFKTLALPHPSTQAFYVSTGLYPQAFVIVFSNSVRVASIEFTTLSVKTGSLRAAHSKYAGLPSDPQAIDFSLEETPSKTSQSWSKEPQFITKYINLSGVSAEKLIIEIKTGDTDFCAFGGLKIMGEREHKSHG